MRPVTVNARTRSRWFDDGAAALRRFVELRPGSMQLPDGDFYCCPCCMWAYDRDAVIDNALTVEHVPADSVGGREMLLTCKDCNNGAGNTLDVYATNREQFRQFLAPGGNSKRYKALVTADGIPLRGEAWMQDGNLMVVGIDKQNHDAVQKRYVAKVNEFVESGESNPPHTFRVLVPRMSDIRANLSWIRSAYLVAFCAFGLPYILHPIMAELRNAFDNPGSSGTPLPISRDETAPRGRRVIGLVQKPVESLLVGLDQYDVLLPSPTNMISIEELTKGMQRYKSPDSVSMTTRLITFPRSAEYRYV